MHKIEIPQISESLLNNSLISQLLFMTINEFTFEEKTVIYLYCFVELPISEIANLTELDTSYIEGILTIYSERLAFKLGILKKAAFYDTSHQVPIKELFEMETAKEMLETEYSSYYSKWQEENGHIAGYC